MNRQAQLDPALNICPATTRRVHLIGICGTGMAALAGMLLSQGYTVTGSDQNVYPPMSDFLQSLHIPVHTGYGAENLNPRPDLVIVGNVTRAINPEALALEEMRIPYLSMPQALAVFFLQGKTNLVVAGTHGKTTTSSLLASTLHRLGHTPSFFIGGLVEAFQRNFNLSESEYFVLEGDEYDTAFFNKVSKFHHYMPRYVILTSVEFDHADIFPDLQAIVDSFTTFIQGIPAHGALVACVDDPVVRELAEQAPCRVISYGTGPGCTWRIEDVHIQGHMTRVSLSGHQGGKLCQFALPMPGAHNAANATGVVALLDYLGFEPVDIGRALAVFEGVKRRQQIRGQVNGVTVIDDFAHHPTAVRETVRALRLAWPDNRLVVVFEPRTNTSRRKVFQQDYTTAFQGADLLLVREHLFLDNIPAEDQFSSRKLVEDIQEQGQEAMYFADTDTILKHLLARTREGDVIAILSNGGFDNIHERLLAGLAAAV